MYGFRPDVDEAGRSCWANSGEREEGMVSIFLGLVGIVVYLPVVIRTLSYSYHKASGVKREGGVITFPA